MLEFTTLSIPASCADQPEQDVMLLAQNKSLDKESNEMRLYLSSEKEQNFQIESYKLKTATVTSFAMKFRANSRLFEFVVVQSLGFITCDMIMFANEQTTILQKSTARVFCQSNPGFVVGTLPGSKLWTVRTMR